MNLCFNEYITLWNSNMLDNIPRRGLMFVLSSPSGAGKTTLTKLLMKEEKHIILSVSATTRTPRSSEVNGRDYYFLTEQDFKQKVAANDFLEYAHVFNHWYGTPKEPVERALSAGLDVLFDIDWQGAQALSHSSKADVVKVFILPPSYDTLRLRLKHRQDSENIINDRMAKASDEISHWAEYDYVVINHTLEKTLDQIHCILRAERLKRHRRIGMVHFVRTLIPTHTL